MPDTITWIGGTSTSMNLAANYSPAQIPINGDSLLGDGNAVRLPSTDMNTLTAVSLAALFIGRDWTLGDWGTSGAPLEVRATRLVCQQTTGTLFWQPQIAGSSLAIVNSIYAGDALTLTNGTGSITELAVTQGTVNGAAYTDNVSALTVSFRTSRGSDARVTLGESTALTQLFMHGGIVSVGRVPIFGVVSGGELTITEAATSVAGADRIAVMNGARVFYDSSATLENLDIINGIVDTTRVTRELTITNARIWPDGRLLRSETLVPVVPEDMTGGDVLNT